MSRSKRYRIVILNHHATAPDTGGGGRHYELGRYLSENGHKVTVIASSYDNGKMKYCFPDEVATRKFNDNFEFVRLKTKPPYRNTITRFINYMDYASKASRWDGFEEPPEVVIASSVHPLAWIAGHRISKKYGARFIVEVRDLWPLSMYEDFTGLTRKLVFAYFEALERKYYNLADAIVTTAPYAYEYMEEKFNIDRGKVFHIPHGIDIEEFDRNASRDESILDGKLREVLNDYFCVTYTGSLSRSEGLSTFVQAAKYLKGMEKIKLVIIGSGSERAVLEEIIQNEDLDNVVMIENQPKSHIPLILKKSGILFCGLMERKVFRYGISKNKFYDYMAAGKPVIFAANVRDSLIDKAQAGITVKPHDPEKLAEAIRYLYNNLDTVGRRFGENGRRYVEEHHTVEKIGEAFLDVIEYACRRQDR